MNSIVTPLLAGMFGGGWEWIIILVIILVLFGSRLPKVARSLGQGISEFKKGITEGGDKASDPADTASKSKVAAKDDIDKTSV